MLRLRCWTAIIVIGVIFYLIVRKIGQSLDELYYDVDRLKRHTGLAAKDELEVDWQQEDNDS
jgi:hypothetical protein